MKNNINFYDNLTLSKFIDAYERSKKNKGLRKDILLFDTVLEYNLYNLIESIKDDSYNIGSYSTFVIYEPKRRVIRKLPFIDRIVHQWYVEEFIKPYYYPRFIYDSYACIKDKGSHKAVKRLQYFMRRMYNKYRNYYIIKMDIHKYFDNIDKDILYEIMKRNISDKYLIKFTYKMIYYDNLKKGLCIGSYTSQFFANIYLNELDYYIKFNLKVKFYIRYMDDFVILCKDKEEAKDIFNLIEEFIEKKLKLSLNPKSNYFPSRKGIDFCGYKIYETHILVRRRNIKKMKKKIRSDNLKLDKSFNSFKSYCKHACSYNIINKIEKDIYKYKNI